jgi:hypothetical protein
MSTRAASLDTKDNVPPKRTSSSVLLWKLLCCRGLSWQKCEPSVGFIRQKRGKTVPSFLNKDGTKMESFIHLFCLTNPAQADIFQKFVLKWRL